jgi:hypothetical protein
MYICKQNIYLQNNYKISRKTYFLFYDNIEDRLNNLFYLLEYFIMHEPLHISFFSSGSATF